MHRHQRLYAVLSLATTYRTSNTLPSSTLHSSGTAAAGHGTESSTLGKMQSKEISMSTTTRYAQPITNNNNKMNQEKYTQKLELMKQAREALDHAIGVNTSLDSEIRDLMFGVTDAIEWLREDYPEYEQPQPQQ